jgi:hypothetical protein
MGNNKRDDADNKTDAYNGNETANKRDDADNKRERMKPNIIYLL